MSKDVLLEQLRSTVVELIQNHKVSHTSIKQEIHNCIKELSDWLPKTKVLYSDIHGGYGYSEQFSKFLECNDLNKDCSMELDEYSVSRGNWILERIYNVKYVEAFGKTCKEKYPLIRKLITIYDKYLLKDVFKLAYMVDFIKSDIKKYDDLFELIKQTDDSKFGTDENVKFVCSWLKDVEKINQYSKSRLLEWIKNKNIQNEMEVQDNIEKISAVIGDARCKLVVDEYGSLFVEEKAEEKKPWYERKKWYEKLKPESGLVRLSFMDAIQDYGEDHFAVWKCQNHYKESAMRFLLRHHSEFEVTDDDMVVADYCSDMDMGLLCASGAYARLCIGEAPQLLAWYIGEYDGKESIVVKP